MPNKDIIATIEDAVKSFEKEEMKITTPRILPRFTTTSEMFPLKMIR